MIFYVIFALLLFAPMRFRLPAVLGPSWRRRPGVHPPRGDQPVDFKDR